MCEVMVHMLATTILLLLACYPGGARMRWCDVQWNTREGKAWEVIS